MINNITINGQNVNFKYGLTINSIFNKDLNTGFLVIPQTDDIQIEPFDKVVITHNTINQIFMIVGNYKKTISKFSGQKLYNYEITLVSPTIKLQRIILPNRSITRKISTDNSLSIYQVIERYISIYAPSLKISNDLKNLTQNTQCPEISWNRPTLFEVLNDLLIIVGCVVTMKDFETISYLDLDINGNPIDESYINNYEYMMDISEYASSIEVEAQNVYSKDSLTSTPSPISVRTSESVRITTDNQELLFQKPIFTLEKLTAYIRFAVDDINILELDLTDKVVSKTVYDLLFPTNAVGFEQDENDKKYRRNYLYFEQGSNIIGGLNFREDNWLSFADTKPSIVHVIYWTMIETLSGQGISEEVIKDKAEELDGKIFDLITFKAEYTTTESVLFRARKDVRPKNVSNLINNQTNSYVYSNSIGKQQKEFVNRIGNEELSITGRFENFNDIPELGDYIDEYILVEKEVQFHKTYYLLNGKLSKNYSKENMFAGINTQKRYTELASESESFISNHLFEKFYKFDFVDTQFESDNFTRYIVQNLGKKGKKILGAIVQTKFENNQESPRFLSEGTPYIFANSLLYSFRMSDNYNVNYALDEEAYLFGGENLKLIPYTDNFGNFKELNFQLYTEEGIKEEALNPDFVNNFSGSRNFLEVTKNASKYPVIESQRRYWTSETDFVDYNPIIESEKIFDSNFLLRYKDNREITSENIQFYFLKNDDIIISDRFYNYLPAIYNSNIDEFFKIAYSFDETYKEGDNSYKGLVVPTSQVNVNFVGNQISIEKTGGTLDYNNFSSWAILDRDFNFLLGVNKNGNQPIFLVNANDYRIANLENALNVSLNITIEYEQDFGKDYIESANLDIGISVKGYAFEIQNYQAIGNIDIGISVQGSELIETDYIESGNIDVGIGVKGFLYESLSYQSQPEIDLGISIKGFLYESLSYSTMPFIDLGISVSGSETIEQNYSQSSNIDIGMATYGQELIEQNYVSTNNIDIGIGIIGSATIEISDSYFGNIDLGISIQGQGLETQSTFEIGNVDVGIGVQGTILYEVAARVSGGPNLQMTIQFTGESSFNQTISSVEDTTIRYLSSPTSMGISAPSFEEQGPVYYDFLYWEIQETGQTFNNNENTIIVNLSEDTTLIAHYNEII